MGLSRWIAALAGAVVATAAVMDAEAQGATDAFDLDKQQAQKAACKYTTKEVEEQQAAALRQIDGVDKREVPPQHYPTLGASSNMRQNSHRE